MDTYKNVKKLGDIELRESLDRIAALVNKSSVINKLPDKGAHIREVKEKFEKEIVYRHELELTHKLLNGLSLGSSHISHTKKMCSIERSPQKERFKPNIMLNPKIEDHKAKLIDLFTSLELQVKQDERVREEQKASLFTKVFKEDIEEYSEDEDSKSTSEYESDIEEKDDKNKEET